MKKKGYSAIRTSLTQARETLPPCGHLKVKCSLVPEQGLISSCLTLVPLVNGFVLSHPQSPLMRVTGPLALDFGFVAKIFFSELTLIYSSRSGTRPQHH